jgi:RHS repeat-associated protein
VIRRRLLPTVLAWAVPAAVQADEAEYYHVDAIASVRAVTDAAGNLVERHDFRPYGEECTSGPCSGNPGVVSGSPLRFTGKERDAETGLDYFGARYHQPQTGRFTSTDPVMTAANNLADPQRWNRYAYARSNPLRYADPDGREVRPVEVSMTGGVRRVTYVDARVVGRLRRLHVDAAQAGVSFTFNNVFRTPAQQNALRTRNTRNTIGTSPHLAGLAVDINVATSLRGTGLRGLTEMAAGAGLAPLANQDADPPHFQASDLITRAENGAVDGMYRLLLEENQRQAAYYDDLMFVVLV